MHGALREARETREAAAHRRVPDERQYLLETPVDEGLAREEGVPLRNYNDTTTRREHATARTPTA